LLMRNREIQVQRRARRRTRVRAQGATTGKVVSVAKIKKNPAAMVAFGTSLRSEQMMRVGSVVVKANAKEVWVTP
jgi:hypothetical protein